jgi:hypothetical protein
VRQTQRHVGLPIGRTARVVFEIDAMRAECSKAARALLSQTPVDGVDFEECARLDDALAKAHSILKSHLRGIMISRITRRSRVTKRSGKSPQRPD